MYLNRSQGKPRPEHYNPNPGQLPILKIISVARGKKFTEYWFEGEEKGSSVIWNLLP